jgi:hypothetical protein
MFAALCVNNRSLPQRKNVQYTGLGPVHALADEVLLERAIAHLVVLQCYVLYHQLLLSGRALARTNAVRREGTRPVYCQQADRTQSVSM